MNLYEDFLNKRCEIGAGMTAKIYSYNGFAYKCYAEDYPKDWIDYEYGIQREIVKSGLPVPCYYESEFPNCMKMDLINGISMYDRLLKVGKDIVMEEMMTNFEKIHQVKGLKFHSISKYMLSKLEQAPVGNEEREVAVQCLSRVEDEINEPDVLCHMDYHFLNDATAESAPAKRGYRFPLPPYRMKIYPARNMMAIGVAHTRHSGENAI